MKNIKICMILLLILGVSSCSFWEVISFDEYVSSISFPKGNVEVYEEGFSSVYLEAQPVDSFEYYDAEFEIVNPKIAEIKKAGENYCFIQGMKVGSTVLRAKLNNKICETIVTVSPNK